MKKIDTSKSVFFSKKMADLKKAFEYLNHEGYFSDREDFSEYSYGVLDTVTMGDVIHYPYWCRYSSMNYKYFMPKSLAVFAEGLKQYRRFKNVKEFEAHTGCNALGKSVIELRNITDYTTHTLLYTGYDDLQNGIYYIHLGGYRFNLQELFKNYVRVEGGKTFILGVEE